MSATLTIHDSSGSWDIVLRDGDFEYRASGSNTGWYRTRRRMLANRISDAYDEWACWQRAQVTPVGVRA